MCDRHSPSSISRRGVAGLLAAGVGLASAPLPAAAQHEAKTLCLMCIDHKFVHSAFLFFEEKLATRGYDVVALAGASLAGKTPRGGEFRFASTYAALREQLMFAKLPPPPAKAMHPGIKRVVVLDHLGCGAYENEFGPLDPDEELVKHRGVAAEVKARLFTPMGLESEFWILRTPGATAEPLI